MTRMNVSRSLLASWLLTALALTLTVACGTQEAGEEQEAMSQRSVTVADFGTTSDGEVVRIFTLTNPQGVEARIIEYGGIVVSLKTPDRDGILGDVVLGYDNLAGYLQPTTPYFGGIIGRYGNRIAKGMFTLDGTAYKLATNNGVNHLHGGNKGFDKLVWKGEEVRAENGVGVAFTHVSPDGDEGYPGTLTAKVTYLLTDDNGLRIDYEATTDKATVVNLTNHSYFNLKDGGASQNVDHVVMINADSFTPVDDTLIPTGEIRPVEGTPFDFRQPMAIGARVDQDNEQLKFGGGYDHNFVLNRSGAGLSLAARVYEPTTGRQFEVTTTEPAIQFYTGNFLNGTITGKGGVVYGKRSGFCLETQHYPDSPNHPDFPSVVLKPGETYHTTTVYQFSAQAEGASAGGD